MLHNRRGILAEMFLVVGLVIVAFIVSRKDAQTGLSVLPATAPSTVLPTKPTLSPDSPRATATWDIVYAPPAIATGTYVPIETPNPTQVADIQLGQMLYSYFSEQPGTVIGEGTDDTPARHSYRVAEVTLPQEVTYKVGIPISGTRQAQLLTFSKFWRLSISGSFVVENSDYELYLDDTYIGVGFPTNDGIATIIFDSSLLHEGARIGVSLGVSPVTYLAERLHLTQKPIP